MKHKVYVVIAVELLTIAALIYRARTPYKLTGPTVDGRLPLDRFKPRRSTRRGPAAPGTIGAVEYSETTARRLY